MSCSGSAIAASLRRAPSRRAFGETAGTMEHTRLGYWLEEAGDGRRRAPPLDGDRDADVADRRRRLHRDVDRLARSSSWSPRRGSSCSSPSRSAATGRAGATAASATRCGSRWPTHARRAGATRRRSPSAAPPSAAVDADRRLLRRARGSTPGTGTAATCRSRPPPPTTASGRRRARRLPRARRAPTRCSALDAARGRRRTAPRPPSAAAPSTRARRPCSRPASRSACATACSRQGVEIYESSPVRALPRGRRRGRGDRTDRRHASAPRRAVLAIGGAAKGRRGPLRGRLTVASSHIVLTEPVPDVLEEIGWTGGECDHRRPRPRPLLPHHPGRPHRLRLGRRPDRDGRPPRRPHRGRPRGRRAQTAAHLLDYFPGLAGRRITHAWGGPIDASPTHLPVVMLAARRPRLRRRRLHRQRRRPVQHGRPHPRLARPRPPRRRPPASPSSTRTPPASRPSPSTGSAAKRSASASSPRRRPSWPAAAPADRLAVAKSRADRLPHRPLTSGGFPKRAQSGHVGVPSDIPSRASSRRAGSDQEREARHGRRSTSQRGRLVLGSLWEPIHDGALRSS